MPYTGTKELDLNQARLGLAGYSLVPESAIKGATNKQLTTSDKKTYDFRLCAQVDGKIYAHQPHKAEASGAGTFRGDFAAGRIALKVDGKWLVRSIDTTLYDAAQEKYHFSRYSQFASRPLEGSINNYLVYLGAQQDEQNSIPISISTTSTMEFKEIGGVKYCVVVEREIQLKGNFSQELISIPGEVVTLYEVTEQGYLIQGMYYSAPDMQIEDLMADPNAYLEEHYPSLLRNNFIPLASHNEFLTPPDENQLTVDLWWEKVSTFTTTPSQNGLDILKRDQPNMMLVWIDDRYFSPDMQESFKKYIDTKGVRSHYGEAFDHYNSIIAKPAETMITAAYSSALQNQASGSNDARATFSSEIKTLSFKRVGNERYVIVVEHELKFTDQDGSEMELSDAEVVTIYKVTNGSYACILMHSIDPTVAAVMNDPLSFIQSLQAAQQAKLKDQENDFSSLIFLSKHQEHVQKVSAMPILDWIPFHKDDAAKLGMTVEESFYEPGKESPPERAWLEVVEVGDNTDQEWPQEIPAEVRQALLTQNFHPLAPACEKQGLKQGKGAVCTVYQHQEKYYLLSYQHYQHPTLANLDGQLLSISEFDVEAKKFSMRGIFASSLNLLLQVLCGLGDYKKHHGNMFQISPAILIEGIPYGQRQFTVTKDAVYLKIPRSKLDPQCKQIKKDFARMCIYGDGRYLQEYYVRPDFARLSKKYAWDHFEQSSNSIVGAGYLFVRSLQIAQTGNVSINGKSSKIIYFDGDEGDDNSYFSNLEFLEISCGKESWELPGFIYTRCVLDKATGIYKILDISVFGKDLADIINEISKIKDDTALLNFSTQKIAAAQKAQVHHLQGKIDALNNPGRHFLLEGLKNLFFTLIKSLSDEEKELNCKKIKLIAEIIFKLAPLLSDPLANHKKIIQYLSNINSRLTEFKLSTNTFIPTTALSKGSYTLESKHKNDCAKQALKAFGFFVLGSILILAGIYISVQTLGTGTLFGLGMAQLGLSVMGVSVPGVAVFATAFSVTAAAGLGAGVGGCAALVEAGQLATQFTSAPAYEAYIRQKNITQAVETIEASARLAPKLPELS